MKDIISKLLKTDPSTVKLKLNYLLYDRDPYI